jgi:hypothetical protein
MEMAFTVVRCGEYEVTLWLHSENDPPADEWKVAMGRLVEHKRKLGGDLSKVRSLAITDGGAPNTVQRGELIGDVHEGHVKTAAVSSVLTNRLKRGIATAIFWLNPNFRAFPPEEFSRALEHLDLGAHGPMLLAALEGLQKSLPGSKTLKAILDLSKNR